jgi:hypothetical protein
MSRALDRPREYHGVLGLDVPARYHARACDLADRAGADQRDTHLDGPTEMPAPDLMLHGGSVGAWRSYARRAGHQADRPVRPGRAARLLRCAPPCRPRGAPRAAGCPSPASARWRRSWTSCGERRPPPFRGDGRGPVAWGSNPREVARGGSRSRAGAHRHEHDPCRPPIIRSTSARCGAGGAGGPSRRWQIAGHWRWPA